MYLLRLAILVMLILLGVVGVLTGSAVTQSALSVGRIEMQLGKPAAGGSSARPGTASAVEKWVVTRAGDPQSFWLWLTVIGLAPLGFGAFAVWYGWRGLRRGNM
jgi:hypothetical protein